MIGTVIWKNWAKWFALEVTGLLPSKGAYGAACNALTTFGIRQVLDYSYFVLWVSHLFWFINGSNPFVSWIASGKSMAPLDGVLVMVSVAFLWVAALKICHEPHLPCWPTHLTGLGFRHRALTIQNPSRLPIMSLILAGSRLTGQNYGFGLLIHVAEETYPCWRSPGDIPTPCPSCKGSRHWNEVPLAWGISQIGYKMGTNACLALHACRIVSQPKSICCVL